MGFQLVTNIKVNLLPHLKKILNVIVCEWSNIGKCLICCYWLLLLGQKSNLSVSFKFEPITTNHL